MLVPNSLSKLLVYRRISPFLTIEVLSSVRERCVANVVKQAGEAEVSSDFFQSPGITSPYRAVAALIRLFAAITPR